MKNLKIGLQLEIGFALIIFFVLTLGVVSYFQTDKIQTQNDILYSHPFKVQHAIGMFRSDLLVMQRDLKDLFLVKDGKGADSDMNRIELSSADAFAQMDILRNLYLGSATDVDSLKQAFIIWNSLRAETLRLFRDGKTDEAANRIQSSGSVALQMEKVFAALQKIDNFARQKALALNQYSDELNNSLNRQLLWLVGVILVLSFFIIALLLRGIRKPITELTRASKLFHDGDMNVRSSYSSKNELGMLAASFNTMVEKIQENTILEEKVKKLAGVMLSEYDPRKFFLETLNALATETGSQMAAIYLLSDDKNTFYHYESIGLDNNARQSFDASSLEGEFGTVLASGKVQHIRNIPDDTRFVFYTVAGKMVPREIITLPIFADNEIVAIISLASTHAYSQQTSMLINSILNTLCARVEGILAYHRNKEFADKLEQQNRELETQKNVLSSQSAELLEQNAELEMQKNQLDEASRLKTSFLSNMSHELRTPLNSVIALTGVLGRRLVNQIPDEEYSFLEVIERNGKHLLALINDILDISRIEAGREEVEITTFSAAALVGEVVGMINPQAKERHIGLVFNRPEQEPIITSDFEKCRHILQNLVGNAIKFTEQGSVTIGIGFSGENMTFTVTDTGVGIAPDHLPHIFDEFRQADGTTSRKFGGTGLGLSIAKKYANLLGGTIAVTSTPGRGSVFTLSMPLQYRPEARIVSQKRPVKVSRLRPVAPVTGSGSSAHTILLVEDSEPAIVQLRDFMEESGYRLLVAHDGEEALRLVAVTIPDAIILDLMMPGIDGFEVLKTLREAEKTAYIPVLILTAKHITKEDLSFLKRNNIHQLIQKGDVNREELLRSVAAMIQPAAIRREMKPVATDRPGGLPLVLVIEDNPDNMITVKALLSEGFTVIGAEHGAAGIELARRHLPDMILMDIALPGADGIETFRSIRSEEGMQHIPVVALTASAMITDRAAIMAHGFDAYIAKPIEEKLFYKTISNIIYGQQAN